MAKAWGGRFSQDTDPRVEAFTESISFDSRLYQYDVRGSQAHARMLAEVGLLTAEERDSICQSLDEIRDEIAAGKMEFRAELEDIHMHIESELIQRIGDTGRKLHTGRSRNDQVATDTKLYIRDALDHIISLLVDVQRAFVGRCPKDLETIVPGFTHLQRAQPVSAAHYWLAWTEKFQRDIERLADCRKRVNISPLGAAALAGSSLPIDRESTARTLGFDGIAANSLDVSSDRDYLLEFCFCLSLIGTHLSAWCEEWILWFSTEFSFLRLPDAYTTGSSIMPQKRNPDVLELIRGKTARLMGAVPQMMFLTKNLPMAYNRDLQEDKPAVFDAVDTATACLELAAAMIEGAELRTDVIASRLDDGFLDATALMEYLIRKGVPMRAGHETVGQLVGQCEQAGKKLQDLTLEDFRAACELVEEDVYSVLGARNAAQALNSYGSGGIEQVRERVLEWEQRLAARG